MGRLRMARPKASYDMYGRDGQRNARRSRNHGRNRGTIWRCVARRRWRNGVQRPGEGGYDDGNYDEIIEDVDELGAAEDTTEQTGTNASDSETQGEAANPAPEGVGEQEEGADKAKKTPRKRRATTMASRT